MTDAANLRNRCHHKLVDPCFRIVNFLLHKSRVNHIVDAIDGQRRLRDVGGNHDLQMRRTKPE